MGEGEKGASVGGKKGGKEEKGARHKDRMRQVCRVQVKQKVA